MFGNGDQLMKRVVRKLPGQLHFRHRLSRCIGSSCDWIGPYKSSALGCVRVLCGRRKMQELQTTFHYRTVAVGVPIESAIRGTLEEVFFLAPPPTGCVCAPYCNDAVVPWSSSRCAMTSLDGTSLRFRRSCTCQW